MTIIHYTGHMISPPGVAGRFPAASEHAVTQAVHSAMAGLAPSLGVGSLAGGADTIFVEELLATGAEAHVILPFPPTRFVATSVERCGPAWVARFQAALARVTSLTVLPADAAADDDGLYTLTTHLAMQTARERARQSGMTAIQLAVWDGQIGQAPAGTWHDIKMWRESGGNTLSIDATRGSMTNLPALQLPSQAEP